jgi:hypothetical protein
LEQQAKQDAPVTRAPLVIELLEKTRAMIGDGNHRGHALKVLGQIEEFLKCRSSGWSKSEAVSFVYQINLIVQLLDGMPATDKAEWGTEPVKFSLKRAVDVLIR